MKSFLLVLALLALASTSVAAVVEERVKLRHIEPSVLVERLQVVLGRDVQVVADDNARTLILRLPDGGGSELDLERQRIIARDIIDALDRPQPKIQIAIYAVQPAMLSKRELENLNRRLVDSPMEFPRGTAGKGVIYWTTTTTRDKDAAIFDGAQGKMPGQEITGNVSVRGRVLPAAGQKEVKCVLELELLREGGAAGEQRVVPLRQTIGNTAARPVLIGSLPGAKEEDKVIFYVWARPAREEK